MEAREIERKARELKNAGVDGYQLVSPAQRAGLIFLTLCLMAVSYLAGKFL